MLTNGLQLIGVTALYGLTFLLVPYFLYGMHQQEAHFLVKLFKTVTLSSLQMIGNVYLLVFLRILYPGTFWVLLVIEAVAIYCWTRKESFKDLMRRFYFLIIRTHEGYYRTRVYIKRGWQQFAHMISNSYKRFIKCQPVYFILLLACFAYAGYVRVYPIVEHSSLGLSDLYVYIEWIKKMLIDQHIFSTGVYFYGLQNVVASLAVLWPVDVVTLMRMLGIAINMLTMLAVFWLARQMFESKWAVLMAMAVFAFVMTDSSNAYFRQSYPTSQEFSMLFWIISSGFFIRYLQGFRQADVIGFGLALCATVCTHYYGVLLAAIFCVCCTIFHIKQLFKNRGKIFWTLAVTVATSMVVALAPLAIGLLMGKPLEGSFGWGLSVLTGTTASDSGSVATQASIVERFVENYAGQSTLPTKYALQFSMLFLSLIVSLLMLFRSATRNKGKLLLGMSLSQCVLLSVYFSDILPMPALFDRWRAEMFYSMMECLQYGIIIELCILVPVRQLRAAASTAVLLALLPLIQVLGLKTPVDIDRVQWDGAMDTYYEIRDGFPRGHWTIVSPVQETILVYGQGYHYELYDFLIEMEDYEASKNINIPTDYVFFFVEKVLISMETISKDAIEGYDRISEAQALQPVMRLEAGQAASSVYGTYASRGILMSKFDQWAKAFMRIFPDDMTVFYEDDEMLVYKYKQNMYYQTNFAIDYGYNVYSDTSALVKEGDGI